MAITGSQEGGAGLGRCISVRRWPATCMLRQKRRKIPKKSHHHPQKKSLGPWGDEARGVPWHRKSHASVLLGLEPWGPVTGGARPGVHKLKLATSLAGPGANWGSPAALLP